MDTKKSNCILLTQCSLQLCYEQAYIKLLCGYPVHGHSHISCHPSDSRSVYAIATSNWTIDYFIPLQWMATDCTGHRCHTSPCYQTTKCFCQLNNCCTSGLTKTIEVLSENQVTPIYFFNSPCMRSIKEYTKLMIQ